MHRRLSLIAYNIRSLWNVGSFFRTADAFNIEHVYLAGYTPTPPRKEISKTAIGADEWVPWTKHEDVKDLITLKKSAGVTVVALEISQDSIPLHSLSISDDVPVCIIVGHEILGVPSDVLALVDHVCHIPMLGRKHSLNVSVAAGIALSHFRNS